MKELLEFLHTHVLSLNIEFGFVEMQEVPQEVIENNLVDIKTHNELRQECPEFIPDAEFDDNLRPTFGFK